MQDRFLTGHRTVPCGGDDSSVRWIPGSLTKGGPRFRPFALQKHAHLGGVGRSCSGRWPRPGRCQDRCPALPWCVSNYFDRYRPQPGEPHPYELHPCCLWFVPVRCRRHIMACRFPPCARRIPFAETDGWRFESNRTCKLKPASRARKRWSAGPSVHHGGCCGPTHGQNQS